MNITTWNVNSVRRRLERVLEWVDEHEPDVLCMQELKCQDVEFPTEAFASRGYVCSTFGQKNWNGVAIVSHAQRAPHDDVIVDFPIAGDGQARGIACTLRPPGAEQVRLVNLYVVNGGELASDKYTYKLQWLDALIDWVREERARWAGPMLVCGDFNIAPGDLDVHDPKRWKGEVLCTDAERERLQRLLDLGFTDTWRGLHPAAKVYSWFDYRGAGFDRNEGLRIDLHLYSAGRPATPGEGGTSDVAPARAGRSRATPSPPVGRAPAPVPGALFARLRPVEPAEVATPDPAAPGEGPIAPAAPATPPTAPTPPSAALAASPVAPGADQAALAPSLAPASGPVTPARPLRVIDALIDHEARSRAESSDHAPVTLFLG